MAAVLTNARRFPMMAERQVVIVKEAQEIQDLNKDIGSKLLLDYLPSKYQARCWFFVISIRTWTSAANSERKLKSLR